MKLMTTYRGLDRLESASATSHLERHSGRLKRLLDKPAIFRAVIREDGTARRVHLSLAAGHGEYNAQSTSHDLPLAISEACDRIRGQLIKQRKKRSTSRY